MRKATLIVLPCCLVLLACPMGCRPPGQAGVSPQPGKTIVPVFDVEVTYYDVSGTGPYSATFSVPGVSGPTIIKNSLATGDWTITVDAFNSDEEKIGSGSVVVAVELGTVVSESVTVMPLEGNGSLAIVISWPSDSIADPAMSGRLEPAGGSTQDLSFSVGTDSASCDLSDLAAGYYSLLLQLSDGAVVEWGSFEAVRIIEGLTTTAGFALEAQDLFSGN